MSLAALLDAGRVYAPEFNAGLSNHRPMALLALAELGADDARLASWATGYEGRLEAAAPHDAWPSGDPWQGRLGDVQAWGLYRSLFEQWLMHEGPEETLATVLPVLIGGCAAAAFHGPIRVAAAVRAAHAGELADALAYWACRYLRLGKLPAGDGTERDVETLLRRLPVLASRRGLIFQRMQEAATSPRVQEVICCLRLPDMRADRGPQHAPPVLLETLARLAAKAYAGSGNFTALHLVTGCHALRVLLPFVDEPHAALPAFWQAYAVAVVAAGMRALPHGPLREWDELVAAAITHDDEHVIKLIDACREEERCYGGDDWRRAASRALG